MQRIIVQVWQTKVHAVDMGDAIHTWLSAYLAQPVKLAKYLPESNPKRQTIRFMDRSQGRFLLATDLALSDLNDRIQKHHQTTTQTQNHTRTYKRLPMNRFRPNIVIGNAPSAWCEDEWTTFRIGNIVFRTMEGCARCTMPTINQVILSHIHSQIHTTHTLTFTLKFMSHISH